MKFLSSPILLLSLASCRESAREPAVVAAQPRPTEAAARAVPYGRVQIQVLESRTADSADVATFAGSRVAQLGFCYDRYGLAADSLLTGRVDLWVHVAQARIDTMAIVSREWAHGSGQATEACVLRRLRDWRWFNPLGSIKFRIAFRPT